MFEIFNQRSAYPFTLMRWIDHQFEKTVVGNFAIRHQKQGADPAGHAADGSSQTTAIAAKSDPTLNGILDLFFICYRKPMKNLRLHQPLPQIWRIGQIGITDVK